MKSFFISLVFVVLMAVPASSSTITGKVVGVPDGDTIKIISAGKQIKIRLYGIDTPEKKTSIWANCHSCNQIYLILFRYSRRKGC